MDIATFKPVLDEWYQDTANGQPFIVVAIDDDAEIIEIQHYDGNMDEISFSHWEEMDLEHCREPDNWTGGYDASDMDAYNMDDMDDPDMDWQEPYQNSG